MEDGAAGAVVESGEMGGGGPFEGDGAGEHGPEGEEENGSERPEFVAGLLGEEEGVPSGSGHCRCR